ncbi:aldo/keto reductase [Mariniflexile sp. AS56]|uniref:aldo/keto reductase n=1 Tax=Mariniflexile sp. AS56 TaxID=3063957 RepID=UPI0026EB9A8D|nr:aldo/keto reductase [Mariniflexile sp. AS56]MDO7172673.1 aldo/keto reductase [Mariniflexile sp. AS56]
MKEKSKIGFGTAAIGRPLYINLKQNKEEEPFSLPAFKANGLEVLEDAYNKGIRFFDTSPGYGIAEELLVDWVHQKNDPSIVVSTKWGYTYVANFNPDATQHEVKEHSLNKLNEQWIFSKKLAPNLKIYQIHSATLDTGVLENEAVLRRLHELKIENGLIIGLTTTGSNQVEVLKKALKIEIDGEKLFQSYQCTFNVLDQSVAILKEALQELEGPFIIKEALANGRLIPNDNYSNYTNLYSFMKVLAEKHQVGIDAVALRYCMDYFLGATVLSGANNSEHMASNLKADTFMLSTSEVEQLSAFGISAEAYWQERKELAWN